MTASQAAVVDHDQGPEVHLEEVVELVSQHLLPLAWEHLRERSYSTVHALDPEAVIDLDPAAVIHDVAEAAQTPTIAEAHLQNVVKTASEARVLQTSLERVLPRDLLPWESVRQRKLANHARMLGRLRRPISAELVEVVVDEEVGLTRTPEARGVLETLVGMPNLVVILTVIHDMPTRAQATSAREVVVEAVALLDRKTDKRTNVLPRVSSLPQTRIAVWDLRRAMRSGSRR
jgi:hypothetical protein